MTPQHVAYLLVLTSAIPIAAFVAGRVEPSVLQRARESMRRLGVAPRLAVLALFGLFVLMHAAQVRWVVTERSALDGFVLAVSNLLPWLAVLPLLCSRKSGAADGAKTLPQRAVYLAMGFSFVASAAWALWRSNGLPLIVDEALYVFQAQLFRQGSLSWSVPPSWEPFLAQRQMVFSDGSLYSQYPPGWPALLGLASLAVPNWLVGPVFVLLLTYATYLLGREVLDEATGRRAALVVAASSPLLYWGSYMMSDVPAAALVTLAGAAAARAARESRWPFACAAGALVGVTVMMRPLTALATVPIVLACAVAALPRGIGPTRVMRQLPFYAVAGTPFVVALLAYNFLTNGGPSVSGYEMAHGSLHAFGIGRRGFIEYTDDGFPFENAYDFEFLTFAASRLRLLAESDQWALGGFFVPLFLASVLSGRVSRRILLLTVATLFLPLIHLFWFFTSARYFLACTPVLAIVAVTLLHRASTPTVRRGFTRLLLLASLTLPIGGIALDTRLAFPLLRSPGAIASHRGVETLANEEGRVVVFAADPGPRDYSLFRLLTFNVDPNSDVYVLRDLGLRNEEILREFPDYSVACLDEDGDLHVLADGDPPTCRSVDG